MRQLAYSDTFGETTEMHYAAATAYSHRGILTTNYSKIFFLD